MACVKGVNEETQTNLNNCPTTIISEKTINKCLIDMDDDPTKCFLDNSTSEIDNNIFKKCFTYFGACWCCCIQDKEIIYR
tara:strand:+ start:483 stop:722 length:240 start_codon:yes stop_codon:yes gene_type:complete